MSLTKNFIEMGKYRDHKGNLYRVVGGARNAITLTEVVIYEALSRNPVSQYWVIPKSKFNEKIIFKGNKIPRFVKC